VVEAGAKLSTREVDDVMAFPILAAEGSGGERE